MTQTPEQKPVTIDDLCERWGYPATEGPRLQKFMGQEGPWTVEEAVELDRRMYSSEPRDLFPGYHEGLAILAAPMDGAHQCTEDEVAAMARLAKHLQGLLNGAGNTPAETRTGVSDAEAAILGALSKLLSLVEAYGGHIGTAAAILGVSPPEGFPIFFRETAKARTAFRHIREIVANVSAWLPQVRGEQAVDADGVPIWYLATADHPGGWLATASPESPGEGWRAVYTR